MKVTREECEDFIIQKLKEIHEFYKTYNPNGNYLSMCINFMEDGNGNDNGDWDVWTYSANNEYYNDASPDLAFPIDCREWVDIKDKKYYLCHLEVDEND